MPQQMSPYEQASIGIERQKLAQPQGAQSGIGKIVADMGGDPHNPADLARAAQLMKSTHAGTNVKVEGSPRYDVGQVPQGQRLVYDEQGRPTHLETLPGSELEHQFAQEQEQASARQRQQVTAADIVGEDINRALALSEGGWTTGVAGQVLSGVGGTAAHNLDNLVTTIKANVGFDKLQQMRASSPTGGALGPVSDTENRLLQSVMGALEQSQSQDQFQYNLKRLHNVTQDIVHGPGQGAARHDLSGSGPKQGAASQQGPRFGDIEDGFRFLGGDPASPSSWEPIQ
jgi:hypothetical protein